MEFFEIERDINQLLNAWIFHPANLDALDTLLINTPLRYRIKAANEFSLLTDDQANMFQALCDERNRLAHGPMKNKTIADMFPPNTCKQFVKKCKLVKAAISKAMDEVLENM